MAQTEVLFALSGVEELSASLKDLSDDVRKKGGRSSLRKAANVVAEAARIGAQRLDDPKTAESISNNVAVRFSPRRFKQTGDLGFRVGILGGAKSIVKGFVAKGKGNPGGDTFYWRFLEFGTERIDARSFMRPALERNIDKATDEFIVEFKKTLDRFARRAQRRAARRAARPELE